MPMADVVIEMRLVIVMMLMALFAGCTTVSEGIEEPKVEDLDNTVGKQTWVLANLTPIGDDKYTMEIKYGVKIKMPANLDFCCDNVLAKNCSEVTCWGIPYDEWKGG